MQADTAVPCRAALGLWPWHRSRLGARDCGIAWWARYGA
jgi:hypothetical protein